MNVCFRLRTTEDAVAAAADVADADVETAAVVVVTGCCTEAVVAIVVWKDVDTGIGLDLAATTEKNINIKIIIVKLFIILSFSNLLYA